MAHILDWSFVLFAQTATVLVMLMSNIFAVHQHLGPPKLSTDAIFYPLLQESSNTSSGSQEWGFSQNWCLSTVFGHVLKWGTPPNHFNRENDDNHCILRPKSGDGATGQWTDHKMSTFLHAPTRTRRGQKGQLTGSWICQIEHPSLMRKWDQMDQITLERLHFLLPIPFRFYKPL